MGWSRQASTVEQAAPSTRAVNFGASLAKSNPTLAVSKALLAAERTKGKSETEEDVVDSDVMTLQELIDNVCPPHRFYTLSTTRSLTIIVGDSSRSELSTSIVPSSLFRNSIS